MDPNSAGLVLLVGVLVIIAMIVILALVRISKWLDGSISEGGEMCQQCDTLDMTYCWNRCPYRKRN